MTHKQKQITSYNLAERALRHWVISWKISYYYEASRRRAWPERNRMGQLGSRYG